MYANTIISNIWIKKEIISGIEKVALNNKINGAIPIKAIKISL
jgi:hypothetical protein